MERERERQREGERDREREGMIHSRQHPDVDEGTHDPEHGVVNAKRLTVER